VPATCKLVEEKRWQPSDSGFHQTAIVQTLLQNQAAEKSGG
jgi:hypothetical protein